ncbi:MAG: hypothetical protein JRJ45_00410 [Deltaproteobacteria bacterium]|nr:hypothetical protein [Deltaproteobacteria bacterium]
MMKLLILTLLLFISIQAQAAQNIELIPWEGFLGRIGEVRIYSFHFGTGTILAPGTRLNVSPVVEIYGQGSIVNDRDGLTHDDCAIPVLNMDGPTGIITIFCEADEGKY